MWCVFVCDLRIIILAAARFVVVSAPFVMVDWQSVCLADVQNLVLSDLNHPPPASLPPSLSLLLILVPLPLFSKGEITLELSAEPEGCAGTGKDRWGCDCSFALLTAEVWEPLS